MPAFDKYITKEHIRSIITVLSSQQNILNDAIRESDLSNEEKVYYRYSLRNLRSALSELRSLLHILGT